MGDPKTAAKPNPGTFKKGEKREGQGKRGPNKMTRELKAMILKALDDAGGVAYLSKQADEKPAAFLALLGKVLPMTIAGEGESGALKIEVVSFADHQASQ